MTDHVLDPILTSLSKLTRSLTNHEVAFEGFHNIEATIIACLRDLGKCSRHKR